MLQHIYISFRLFLQILALLPEDGDLWPLLYYIDLTSHMNFSHAEVGGMMGRGKNLYVW